MPQQKPTVFPVQQPPAIRLPSGAPQPPKPPDCLNNGCTPTRVARGCDPHSARRATAAEGSKGMSGS